MKLMQKGLLLAAASVQADAMKLQTTPMARVASLLTDMKARIHSDGQTEQVSYDKYACWCEDTLGRKARDISAAKQKLGRLDNSIKKLEGEIGSHVADIKQLDKDVSANKESQSEAASIRNKEAANYENEKVDSEQCIGALEAAIKVLSGAGTKAQLISVAVDVRGVVERADVAKRFSDNDLNIVKQFVANPQDFVGGHGGFLSAAQTSNNPFGDYAPQSTQIQGILKGMYDSFSAELERDNVAEADAQKAFQQLMSTKQQELATLQATLEKHQLDRATKSDQMAQDIQMRDDTKVQLAADETLFEDVKGGCKTKAGEWAGRTQLRTEELTGIGQAVGILTDPASVKVFTNSTTTFIQMASNLVHVDRHLNAYDKVAHLAQQFHSIGLAQLAVQLKAGGHFDKVIASLDQMIAVLRKEEQEDIGHRDRCQRAEGKNANDVEDLGNAIQAATTSESALDGEQTKLQTQVGTLAGDISAAKQQIRDALDMRNTEVGDFKQALTDDTDALALLEQAIATLSRFYKRNGLPLALIKKRDEPEPKYTVDPNKAPETSWSTPYSGHNTETHGVIAILDMLREDIEKEVSILRADDAKSQRQFETEKGAMEETLDAHVAVKIATEKDLLSIEKQLMDTQNRKAAKSDDLDAENKLKETLFSDCSWVATHFQTRRDKRKAEIQGLVDAKGFLGGVDSGI